MQTSTSIPEPIDAEPIAARRSHASRIVILADDLTGACDSGVAFLRSGRRVRVVLDISSFDTSSMSDPTAESGQVWSFTTESRNVSVEEATRCLTESMLKLPHADSLFFKKVDSAARGHLGTEIVATLRASSAAIALVAPAFPAAGRTVQAGILRVSDFTGQNSTTSLHDLFPREAEVQIDILPIGTIDEIDRGIAAAIANGIEILLCDTNTQEHLHDLAVAALRLQKPILWAGSAGLAHALAEELLAAYPACIGNQPIASRPGRNLLFVGTPHPVTRLQVSRLDPSTHETCLIKHGSTSEEGIRTTFQSSPVSALILTGGDTAAFVLRSLKASSILLCGEVAHGIPWGIVEGGLADGCVVITKSGGFGDPEALVQAFEFCARRQREST